MTVAHQASTVRESVAPLANQVTPGSRAPDLTRPGYRSLILTKSSFKQALLPLSHSQDPSCAIGFTLSQCLLY